MTHTRKGSESVGEDDRVILSAALCFSAACSHDLCHEIAHLLGGAFLHLPRDVGVGSQCESRIEVTEHTGDRFHVYTVLQRQRCECVSQVVKSQVFQPSILQDFLVDVHH